MSRLDDLPPDQHATLSLLLSRRKSYAEVATLLSIPERAVHDRAHAALAVLAPRQARELGAEHRELIGDYLLGQQTGVAERLATRTYLDGSASGRAWANAISEEIAPLSSAPLPEVPPGAAFPTPDAHDENGEPSSSRKDSPSEGPIDRHAPQRSSRLGGALLLAVIAAAVIVAVILIVGGGGGSQTNTTTTPAASTTGTTSTGATSTGTTSTGSSTGGPTEDARLTLTSTDPASKAVGVVEILSEDGKHAFYLAAEHLPPSKGFFYAVWLYNSPTSHEALSKSPSVGSNGTLQGGALLPTNAGQYHEMLLTRETSNRPSQPGPIVLSGSFSLGH
jgi:hypothetical protein